MIICKFEIIFLFQFQFIENLTIKYKVGHRSIQALKFHKIHLTKSLTASQNVTHKFILVRGMCGQS